MSINVPNALAWFRILSAPVLFFLLINRDVFTGVHLSWFDYFAAVIFVLAAITDFFDGYIARLWNQATELGEILDPLADKMLILAAFLGLMMIDRANGWAVFLILSREFFITGLRVVAVSRGLNVKASSWGKWKTGLQITAIIFLILNWIPIVSEILLWVAVAITLYSGYEYVREYTKG